MRRRIAVFFVIMTFLPVALCGQTDGEIEVVAKWSGSNVEDMDGEEVERLCVLMRRPMRLNVSSQAELLECELLSRYQVASLLDYRERNGWVMSFMELAAVDGFGQDFVERIRPFVSLDLPSAEGGSKLDNEILLRTVMKTKDGNLRYSYASRYLIESGKSWSAAVNFSRSLDASRFRPDLIGGHFCWRLRKVPLKLIVGDFNARFGQGLTLWNGMIMSAYESPSSFMRRPSGITASGSLTGKYAYTGLASTAEFGNFVFSAMLSVPGIKQAWDRPDEMALMPAINLTYNWRNGQAGITHYSVFSGPGSRPYLPDMKTSADMALCVRGIDVFSELTYDWVARGLSGMTGVVFPVGEKLDMAAALRLSKEEYALALSAGVLSGKWMNSRGTDGSQRRNEVLLSADVTYCPEPKDDARNHSLQMKFRAQWNYIVTETISVIVRLTERARSWGTMFRTDLRTDLKWSSEYFSSSIRMNFLRCVGTSFMSYAEGGFRRSKVSLYLRQGVFLVDEWDDRIYVYERDVPGAFNVPACYGRGLWTSFVSSWKPARGLNFNIRVAYTAYPFMKERKPGRAELSFQFVSRF